jgi:hypothetical protein
MKWLISALFLIIFPTIVHAWSEDILLHFQPYITIQEEYDSNTSLSATNKQGDFLTTISPGFRFSTTPRSPTTRELRQTPTAEDRYGMDLDFNAGFNFYAKNHEDNYISLNGTLNAWYALTQKLNFRVRDYLIRSDDIREVDYSPTAIEGQYLPSRTIKRVPYIRNVFEPSLQYQFGKENLVALNYRNNVYNIQSRTSQDSMENYINPKITYWFDIRNGVSFEYGLTLGNFQRSPDLVGHMFRGSYTYRFNPKTSIFGEYTQLLRDFDPPSVDYVVYRPSIGIEHAFSPTLSGRLQVGYYWADPEEGSTTGGPFYDILVTQRAQKTTYTLSLQGGYTEDFFTSENRGFTQSHRGIGRVTYQLLEKMNVGLFTSYEWQKFIESAIGGRKQTNNIWEIGGNASYELFKWLKLSLEVNYTKNFSNINSTDYSDYRGIFKVTATY